MTNRASITAEYMAFFRALESLRPTGSRLFVDTEAPRFLTGGRKWFYRVARLPAGRGLVESLLDRASPGARAAGIARTKWIDEQVTEALEGATQLVLLGAGFDMRAQRLQASRNAVVFELDHPVTSHSKQAVLGPSGRPLAERARYVAIDFNRRSIAEVLLGAGFDPSQRACLIWEGVTNYLTDEAVDGTLRQIGATVANGSILVFTYVERAVLDHPERFFGGTKLLARVKSYGEPWTFGVDPEELRPYLEKRGFELLQDVSAAEVWLRFGRPASAIRGYEFYRIATTRVRENRVHDAGENLSATGPVRG